MARKKPQRMTPEQLSGIRLSLGVLLTTNIKGNRNLFAYFACESNRLALCVPDLLDHIDALEAELASVRARQK